MRTIFLMFTSMLFCTEAWALRCHGDLVSEGDRKIEVIKACGEPMLKEVWTEETVEFHGDEALVVGDKAMNSIELWTYNFGPTQFFYFLQFVNGRLEGISTGPHGFNEKAIAAKATPKCRNNIAAGDRKIEVLMGCGEPATRDVHTVERIIRHKQDGHENVHGTRLHVNVEEWTYNFGPSMFLLFVTLENGVVVSIETGDHGF